MTRLLLLCGIVAPLVYLATVIAGAAAVPQYSHIAMAVSALAQRGTPHPMVIEIGFSLSAVLSAAFGFGIWKTAGDRDGALHLSGALLIAYGIVALMITTAFPMDPVGGEVTLPGIMHLVLVGLSAMILLAAILLAGFAFGRNAPWFRAYSVVSALLMLLGGAFAYVSVQRGLPLSGLAERITLAAYLVWILVFAATLLRRGRGQNAAAQPAAQPER